jgi:hypothetical protein
VPPENRVKPKLTVPPENWAALKSRARTCPRG